jgi:hypothetical protein
MRQKEVMHLHSVSAVTSMKGIKFNGKKIYWSVLFVEIVLAIGSDKNEGV